MPVFVGFCQDLSRSLLHPFVGPARNRIKPVLLQEVVEPGGQTLCARHRHYHASYHLAVDRARMSVTREDVRSIR